MAAGVVVRNVAFVFLVLVVVSTQVGDYARVMSLILLVKVSKKIALLAFLKLSCDLFI